MGIFDGIRRRTAAEPRSWRMRLTRKRAIWPIWYAKSTSPVSLKDSQIFGGVIGPSRLKKSPSVSAR